MRIIKLFIVITLIGQQYLQPVFAENRENPSKNELQSHYNEMTYIGQDSEFSALHEHDDAVYQATTFSSLWSKAAQGADQWQSQLEYWRGTDQHKLWIQAELERKQSEAAKNELKILYRRALSEFWDGQVGVDYQQVPLPLQQRQINQSDFSAVLGVHGLAAYFIEIEATLSLSKDQSRFDFESSREFWLTQKWVLKPYFNSQMVLHDQGLYARKTGLNRLQTGLEMRYEFNKQIMPFIDFAYVDDKGFKNNLLLIDTEQQQTGRFGLGLRLKF